MGFKPASYRYALGQTIKELRVEKSLTLRQLHERSAVSIGHLSEVETGKKEVSSEVLASIARGLRVPLHELIIACGFKIAELHGFSIADQLLEQELSYVS